MRNIIETRDLTKVFKDTKVVNKVNISVKEGDIYGFLGPNGAGKSTTIKMILGLVKPTEGTALINKYDIVSQRKNAIEFVGAMVEAPSFYGYLSGYKNLKLYANLYQKDDNRINEVLELVGLSNAKNKKVSNYSLGMKQRLGLASALLGEPPILILDEPTNGLDPAGIHEIRNLVKSLPKRYDCTVLISSHMLSEIELLADDIGILNHGRLLFEGSLEDLKFIAHEAGFENDNLEEMFLSMIDEDNTNRKQRLKL